LEKHNWKSAVDNYKQELIGKLNGSKNGVNSVEDDGNKLYQKKDASGRKFEHILYLNEYNFSILSTGKSEQKKQEKVNVYAGKLITNIQKQLRENNLTAGQLLKKGKDDGY